VTNGVYVFPAGKKLKKANVAKNRFKCNTSIGIRICIIRIITTVFYLRRSAINLATDSPLVIEAFKDPLSFVSPAK
jgi:hypothetical protein